MACAYAARRGATGFCGLTWDRRAVRWTCHNAGLGARDRRDALRRVLPEPAAELAAVAIDGRLLPGLDPTQRYRYAECLMSRGRIARRGKTGQHVCGHGRA